MKKRTKRINAIALMVAMLLSLVACGGGGNAGEEEGGKITLKFSFDQGVGEPTQKIVDKFNESQDKICEVRSDAFYRAFGCDEIFSEGNQKGRH